MREKKRGALLVGIALATVCLASCAKEETAETIQLLAPAEAVVDVETVLYRDLYVLTTKDAEIAPHTEELFFEAGGRVAHVYAEIGSKVKAGDLLLEQEEDGVKTAAGNAIDKYLSEKKTYVDTVKNARKKIAASTDKEEIEWYEMIIRQAEEIWAMQEPVLWEAWEAAKAKVGFSKIYAPYDGVITACASKGDVLAAGQSAVAVADTNRQYVMASGYTALSTYAGYERVYAIVNGKETALTYVEELMEEEGSYTYYVAEEENGAKIGDFVLVCMVSDYYANTLSVPNNAVYKDSSGSYVYLLEGDIRVRQDVLTGYKNDAYTEILDGLKEGDRVYVKN